VLIAGISAALLFGVVHDARAQAASMSATSAPDRTASAPAPLSAKVGVGEECVDEALDPQGLPSYVFCVFMSLSWHHHTSSPWQNGFMIAGGAEFWRHPGMRVSLVPIGSYTRSMFTGGVDQIVTAGIQVRRRPERAFLEKLPTAWYGVEGSYGLMKTSYDSPGFSPETTHGLEVGGVAGFRILETGNSALHLTGGVMFTHYGDPGITYRLGIEFRPGWK
jgi:hypothetical protein